MLVGGLAGRSRPAPRPRQVPQPRPADRGPRRGHARPVPRHPHPQRARADRALHRDRQGHRLAVDADVDPRRAGGDDDGRHGQHAQAGGVPAAEQPGRLRGAVDRDRHHPEHTAVQPRAAVQACYVPGAVGVAGDQERLRRVDRHVAGDRRQPWPAVALQQVGQRVQGRAELVAAVAGRLDHLGVGAERRVVHERLTADHAQVDAQVDAVGQRVEARRRVLAVQAQVEGEVVAGARGDHQEGNVMLGGDAGHERLSAVAARDAEQVGAARDRLPRHLRHVDLLRAAHHEHLRPESLRLPAQVELPHLPAAGPRIHDHERMPCQGLCGELGHPPVRPAPSQRTLRRQAGEIPARCGYRRHPEQAGERVYHQHDDRRQDENRQRQPAQEATAGQRDERGREADRGGGQADRDHGDALPARDCQQDRDAEKRQRETQACEPASAASVCLAWHLSLTPVACRSLRPDLRDRRGISPSSALPGRGHPLVAGEFLAAAKGHTSS